VADAQLQRNCKIQQLWYIIFAKRAHLLISGPVNFDEWQLEVGDVVWFLYRDPSSTKMRESKLGIVKNASA
jgi:hypothetical protein